MNKSSRPQIAAYYFPNYHEDVRNTKLHGPGWTEWNLLREAGPRYCDHQQPKVPAWGYTDEANPKNMAVKINAAASHGIDAFIFDWYRYNDGTFLNRALEMGYLKAENRNLVKFALMWANHDWCDIFPKRYGRQPSVLYPGAVSRATFDSMVDYVIERYFSSPCYWRIEGSPYFSIYDLPSFVSSMGGLEGAADALRYFRERANQSGYPKIHLNLVLWQYAILSGEKVLDFNPAILAQLGFDSITSYVWVHHVPLTPFPKMPYLECWKQMQAYISKVTRDFPTTPYYPNATMGWDPSPRTHQSDPYENEGYPFTAILSENTPDNFRSVLHDLRLWLSDRPANQRILTINAWNEWTEGSYLEPDTVNGFGYLEAIRETFGASQLLPDLQPTKLTGT